MKSVFKSIRTTVVGGMFFVVPVVIVAVVFGKAFKLMMVVAKPLDTWIPADSIGGIAMANVLAAFAPDWLFKLTMTPVVKNPFVK